MPTPKTALAKKKRAHLRIAGPDRKGIIAGITGFLFEHHLNIEDIDQRILDGYLTMNMLVDVSDVSDHLPAFQKALVARAKTVGVTADFRLEGEKRIKNVALLVTTETHCARAILERLKNKTSKGRIVVMIGNSETLRSLAKRYRVPFYFVPSTDRKAHEKEVLRLLDEHAADLVVLARYMQILSPDFVFRYEGRIINIHPSLLPAFPGPRAYHQAHVKGVDVIGATAHFVTTNLDEGPIICQASTRIDKTTDSVETYIKKGQPLEAAALTQAVDLFLSDRLCLRRGKVLDLQRIHASQRKTASFYAD